MTLLSLLEPPGLAGALAPTDAPSANLMVQLLAEMHELRETIDYQTRMIEWLADSVERLDTWHLQTAAAAERLTTNATVH